MKTIQYRIQYAEDRFYEIVEVQARDINSGYIKAIKFAKVPLGNGQRREVARVEFWQVTS